MEARVSEVGRISLVSTPQLSFRVESPWSRSLQGGNSDRTPESSQFAWLGGPALFGSSVTSATTLQTTRSNRNANSGGVQSSTHKVVEPNGPISTSGSLPDREPMAMEGDVAEMAVARTSEYR